MIKMSSPSAFLDASVDGSTGWLVLNRPERRNALNAEMWAAIPALISSFNATPDVRVIVIRGAGTEAFAAGADISEFGAARNDSAAAARYEEHRFAGAALVDIREIHLLEPTCDCEPAGSRGPRANPRSP